jgi:hypothetical protein
MRFRQYDEDRRQAEKRAREEMTRVPKKRN